MGQLDHIVRLALDGAFAQRPGLENALAAWERIYAKAGETQAAVNALLRVLRRGRHSEVATEIRDKVTSSIGETRVPRLLDAGPTKQAAALPASPKAEGLRTQFSEEPEDISTILGSLGQGGQRSEADGLLAEIALCQRRRDWPGALQAAQALNTLAADRPEGLSEAAVALSHMGRNKEAEALVRESFERFPNNGTVVRAAASVAEVQQDYELALQRWDQHRRLLPENRAGYVGALQILQKTRRLDLAGTVIEDAEERFPCDPKIMRLLGAIAAREGRWQEADAHWQKLVKLHPEKPDFALSAALAPMGHRRSRRERMPEILARLDALHEKFPDFIPGYLGHLTVLRDAGKKAEAEALSRDWCNRFPDNADLALARASIFEASGKLDEALALLQSLRRQVAPSSGVEAAYVRILSRSGQDAEADEACLEALRAKPDERVLLSEYARIASRRGDWVEAHARWEAALGRLPGNRQILHEITLVRQELAGQADADNFAGTSAAENLFSRFESLGGTATGCEFGMVQRKFGSEGLGLLRWTRSDLSDLKAMLDQNMVGVGEEENTILSTVHISAEREEYVTADKRFVMKSNTFVKVADVPYERMFAQTCRRLRFLRGKLIEDLKAAEKIFVFKLHEAETDDSLRDLYRALRRYGDVTLLCVMEANKQNARGTIRVLEPGLLVGYIGYFIKAGDGGARGIDFVTWKVLAEQAERLRLGAPQLAAQAA